MCELLKAIKASEVQAAGIARKCREEIRRIDDALRSLQHPTKAERPCCGALIRSGGYCLAPAVRGVHRCRMHGGGGFDAVEIRRIMLRNQRKELAEYLRIADVMAGRGTRKIPSSVGQSLRERLKGDYGDD